MKYMRAISQNQSLIFSRLDRANSHSYGRCTLSPVKGVRLMTKPNAGQTPTGFHVVAVLQIGDYAYMLCGEVNPHGGYVMDPFWVFATGRVSVSSDEAREKNDFAITLCGGVNNFEKLFLDALISYKQNGIDA